MMEISKLQRYWRSVRDVENDLKDKFTKSQPIFVISLDNPTAGTTAGAVCEVDRFTAAKAITDKTHRLATKPEIAGHKAAELERRQSAQDAELRRRHQSVVIVGSK